MGCRGVPVWCSERTEREESAQAGAACSGTSELGPLHSNMNAEQIVEVGKDKTEAGSRDKQGREQRARQEAQGEATKLVVGRKENQQSSARPRQGRHMLHALRHGTEADRKKKKQAIDLTAWRDAIIWVIHSAQGHTPVVKRSRRQLSRVHYQFI